MVSAKRKAISIGKVLWESIKKSVKQIKGLAQDRDFIGTYKYCYPDLWRDVCEYHREMKRWNRQRVARGLRAVYPFDSPEAFLLSKSRRIAGMKTLPHTKNDGETSGNDEHIEALRRNSLENLSKRLGKERQRERYKQHVQPSYARQHIQTYYEMRKRCPADIDTRYLIIHELAKYKCDETIRFLRSLVQCEKNVPLQHYAWECLNSMGITGTHKGRRKGKKKMTHTQTYSPIATLQNLLKAIYNSPLEKMKQYDLFLSHSYKDKGKLIELKDTLNRLGLNVYMDWVNDKDELLRTLTSADTATVITERIKVSKAILYVHTNSSLDSKWTPWELGYAYALGKPILVYRPELTTEEPEYLQLYHSTTIEKGEIFIENQKRTKLTEWLREMIK